MSFRPAAANYVYFRLIVFATRRPDVAIFVDYGQIPAQAEEAAARAVCEVIGLRFEVVRADCSALGSGDMAGAPGLSVSPVPEWWPFRNQLILTLAGVTALRLGATSLMIGALVSDGDATILAKDWASLVGLSRQLREFGTPIVGPGARPYKRSRLFAQLAEQFCGALTDPNPETSRQLERALFHAIQDVTGQRHIEVFSHGGRVVLIRLMREARRLADTALGAVAWLDAMSQATGTILFSAGYLDRVQSGLFYASVQEMKADMQRQNVNIVNLAIEDLGLFASPMRALRLSTLHYAKGREYDAVAMIGLRKGAFPYYRSDDVDAEKRLFYVGVTRARKLLMYVAERDKWGNPPSIFLGPDGVNMV